MIVTSVASSHHRSEPGNPKVTARLNPNATMIASEMSVIIPGRRSRSSATAPRMNTEPPYPNTSAPNTAGTQRDAPGPPGAAVGEPVLNHRGPDDRGHRQQERPPELLAEHLDGMASVC